MHENELEWEWDVADDGNGVDAEYLATKRSFAR